jgi:beta-xylosidase
MPMTRPRSMHALTSLALAALLSACASTQRDTSPSPARNTAAPAASPNTYSNPIHAADFPDPFVARFGDRFYAYATHNANVVGAEGFQVITSTNLIDWSKPSACFTPAWAAGNLWAPEVYERAGRYYLFYCAKNPQTRRQDIAVAVASSPTGPFTDHAMLVRTDDTFKGIIDPTLFTDDDGQDYLLYSQEEPRALVLRPLAKDFSRVESERTQLITPTTRWEGGVVEAPTLLRRDGAYVLLYSAGGFAVDKRSNIKYAVWSARSDALRGPYTKSSAPVLKSVSDKVYLPGHQCVLSLAPDGSNDWLFYHAWNAQGEPRYQDNPEGRTLRMDRLTWRNDTPWVEGPTTSPRPAPQIP